MADVRQISFEDIVKFYKANNKSYKNRDDAYDKVLTLLKDKKSVGHPISIVEWMIAHNLIIKQVDIPIYNIYDIDNMSQEEINQLAKLLTMKGNDKNNIINILRYLGKLDERMLFVSDIKNLIENIQNELDIKDIDIYELSYDDIIYLLKTSRNKQFVRKFISDNLEKIIIYNIYEIKYTILESILAITNIYNKIIILDIIKDNKKELLRDFDEKQISDIMNDIKNGKEFEVYITENERVNLIRFTVNLLKIGEIGIVRKLFNIADEFKLFESYDNYNYRLVDWSMDKDVNSLKVIIDFIGEDEFVALYKEILFDNPFPSFYIKKFLENLIKLEKYNLIIKIIEIYIDNNYKNQGKIINKILLNIKNAIQSKDNDLIFKYINSINF